MPGLPPEPAVPEGREPPVLPASPVSLAEQPTPVAAMPNRPKTNFGNRRRFVFMCVASLQKRGRHENGSKKSVRGLRGDPKHGGVDSSVAIEGADVHPIQLAER